MIVHQWPRRSGKTKAAIEFLLEDPEQNIIIVVAQDRKRYLLDQLPHREDFLVLEKRVVTWTDLIQGNARGRTYKRVWFDQLDHMLASQLLVRTDDVVAVIDSDI